MGWVGEHPVSCSTEGRMTVCPAWEKVNKDAHPPLLKDANSLLCQQTTFPMSDLSSVARRPTRGSVRRNPQQPYGAVPHRFIWRATSGRRAGTNEWQCRGPVCVPGVVGRSAEE